MSGHEVLLDIAGGVALLLWATRMIRTGILRAYGADLRRVLGRSTRNRFSACGAGLAVTTLVQSSTATALLVVSFASRGLIATAAGLAIMLGADVGSTLVVQVLSFDLGWLSPALVLLGVITFLGSSSALWRHLSRVTIGLGLMLLSLSLGVDASATLRGSEILPTIMAPLASDPILALLLTAVLAWICHSSVAVVLLVMSFTVAQIVPLELGFVMVLGANVGSGIIPLVLSLSDSPAARRIPLGNLLFRVAGALLLLPLVDLVTPYLALIETDSARQIANFHTLFNLALAACSLPLIGLMTRLTERMFPDASADGDPGRPKYLNSRLVNKPSEALACATREALRMADSVEMMLRGVI
ncbi:MAG: Na/Pi cotransporter family protein, partial [Salinisphaera sp.]|nr:Na/Pi cotransporter family protein [Salinisphaera sp.]